MRYRAQSAAPMDADAFTTAAHRQPQGAFFRRSYLAFHTWTLVLMAFVFLGAIALGNYLVDLLDPASSLTTIALSVLPFVAALIVWIRYHASMMKAMYQRMLDLPLYDGSMAYDVSEKGLSMQSETAHWSVDWPAMDKVSKHPKGIFMYAGGFIYVIPKDVAPAEIYDDMWADIRSWFEANQ